MNDRLRSFNELIEVLGHEIKILTNYQCRPPCAVHWSLDDLVTRGLSQELREFRSASLHLGLRAGVAMSAEGTMVQLYHADSCSRVSRKHRPGKMGFAVVEPISDRNSICLHNLDERPTLQSAPRLSPRETQCLAWQARGLKPYETAIVMKNSARTAQYYLDNIRGRLRAETIAHDLPIAKDIHIMQLHCIAVRWRRSAC